MQLPNEEFSLCWILFSFLVFLAFLLSCYSFSLPFAVRRSLSICHLYYIGRCYLSIKGKLGRRFLSSLQEYRWLGIRASKAGGGWQGKNKNEIERLWKKRMLKSGENLWWCFPHSRTTRHGKSDCNSWKAVWHLHSSGMHGRKRTVTVVNCTAKRHARTTRHT